MVLFLVLFLFTVNYFSKINSKTSSIWLTEWKIIPSNICIHNRLELNIDDIFFKLSYQKTVLKKVFKNTGTLSVIEYLDLETQPLTIISFTYLLQFCYEHNENIFTSWKYTYSTTTSCRIAVFSRCEYICLDISAYWTWSEWVVHWCQ